MQNYDLWLLEKINHFTASSNFLFQQAVFWNDTDFIYYLMSACLVGLWIVNPGYNNLETSPIRQRILLIFTAFFPTYVIARLFQMVVHRPRPIVNIPLEVPQAFQEWWNAKRITFTDWGSFPSDHAALLFIFITIFFSIDKKLGWMSLLLSMYYNFLRIAVGLHWPIDIVGGALLGSLVAVSLLLLERSLKSILVQIVSQFNRHPFPAYALSFMFLCDFSNGFEVLKSLYRLILQKEMMH